MKEASRVINFLIAGITQKEQIVLYGNELPVAVRAQAKFCEYHLWVLGSYWPMFPVSQVKVRFHTNM